MAIVRALGVIKQACAMANKTNGTLEPRLADAIIAAAGAMVAAKPGPNQLFRRSCL